MSEEVANEIANAASSQSGNTSPFFSESANAIISALNGETVTESTRYSPEVNRIIKAINEGGGGGGDFTTAKVTLDFTENFRPSTALVSAGTYRIGFAYLYDGEGFATLVCDNSDNFNPDGGSLETDIDVPLYKGSAFFSITFFSGFQSDYISFDGSVETSGEGLLVTGDCAITLSGAEI